MKKSVILFPLLIIPFLASCKESSIDMPKSPFIDHYERIGMEGEYKKTDEMDPQDYSNIKAYINNPDRKDIDVASYHRQDENRDLKYAYFGEESSTISQCSMTSRSEDLVRYSNNVFINTDVTDQQIQTANGGIQKTKLTSKDYTFDLGYDDTLENKYVERIETKKNNEGIVVTEPVSETTYTPEDVDNIFGLRPYSKRIWNHFDPEQQTAGFDFKLLANENNAVYYMTRDEGEDRYLIKEGYSLFPEFHTTMGRSYKSQENYFYEGLLEKKEITPGEYLYRFTKFRFYHELLILSKAIDGEDVPILYLDKPVLIEFSETKYYDIKYSKQLDKYEGEVPPSPTEA